MKLVLLLVSVIAVFTADSRDFTDKPDGGDSADDDPGSPGGHSSSNQDQLFPDGPVEDTTAGELQTFNEEPDVYSYTEAVQNFHKDYVPQNSEYEDQQFKDGSELVTDEPQLPGSSEVDHQKGKGQNERGLRGSQCSANAICGIVGGSCIGNLTVCRGWLVSEGCKGSCKCCIPRSQEMQMTIFTLELESMKEGLVNSSLQLRTDLQSLIENINNTNAGLNKQLDTKLDIIKAEFVNHGCPDGSFLFAPSEQCFKVLNNTKYNWATAKQKCHAQGLELAKPYDPVALRHYLTSRYGLEADSWVGAQGTGSITKWQRDGKTIATNSILWYSGYSGAKSSSYCLVLATHPSHEKGYPNNPYYMSGCTNSLWAVCEFVRE